MKETSISIPADFTSAVQDIKLAILKARANASRLTNSEALKLYFFVGGYISKKTRSAQWGSGAIDALSSKLQAELPGLRGFSATNIKNMRIFFEAWCDTMALRQMPSDEMTLLPIRQMPSDELEANLLETFFSVGFSHHVKILMKCKNRKETLYYITRCAREMWSYQELLEHLRANDYRHVGTLPNNFTKTLSPMTLATKAVRSFRDEYLLELVNLDNVDAIHDQDVDERVLSKTLVSDVEKTIQALGGSDFCFMGREKRLVVEGEEIFIDLLFYHRGLRAMVAVELKMGKFRASYLGQLALYLSALDKLERKPDENPTIGLLLCEEMNKPFVQLAVCDISKPIGIATYKSFRSIPKPYKTLAPIIEAVKQIMAHARDEESTSMLEMKAKS